MRFKNRFNLYEQLSFKKEGFTIKEIMNRFHYKSIKKLEKGLKQLENEGVIIKNNNKYHIKTSKEILREFEDLNHNSNLKSN